MVISGTAGVFFFVGKGGRGAFFVLSGGDSRCILLYSIYITFRVGRETTGSTLRAARPRTVYFETGVLRKNVFHV